MLDFHTLWKHQENLKVLMFSRDVDYNIRNIWFKKEVLDEKGQAKFH